MLASVFSLRDVAVIMYRSISDYCNQSNITAIPLKQYKEMLIYEPNSKKVGKLCKT